jgi:Tfp pilus assembly protein PilO
MNTMTTPAAQPLAPSVMPLPAKSVSTWLSALRDGFLQPLEYWPWVQRAVALALLSACACGVGLWLCAAADVSGREARRQALAALETTLENARTKVAALDGLRRRSRQLGATSAPEPVPDNGALLTLISHAIDRSDVVLDQFEPGTPTQVAGVDEALLHVRARGAYAQLARFAGELAVLAQPVIPTEMRVARERNGALLLDAQLRVIGAPHANSHWGQAGFARKLSGLADPFKLTIDPADSVASDPRLDSSSEIADDRIAGTLEASGHRAVLVRTASGWRLIEIDMPVTSAATERAYGARPARAAP